MQHKEEHNISNTVKAVWFSGTLLVHLALCVSHWDYGACLKCFVTECRVQGTASICCLESWVANLTQQCVILEMSLYWLYEKKQTPCRKSFHNSLPQAPRIHKHEVRMDREYVRLESHHLAWSGEERRNDFSLKLGLGNTQFLDLKENFLCRKQGMENYI